MAFRVGKVTSLTSPEGGAESDISTDLRDPLIMPLVPPQHRAAINALWSLHARLAQMARSGSEPALRQIRLTWWRDQLSGLRAGGTAHDPLLQLVAEQLLPIVTADALASLAEAWIAEVVAEDGVSDGERGAQLFALTATMLRVPTHAPLHDAGRGWAITDSAATDAARFEAAGRLLSEVQLTKLPKCLAAVTGLARRIARHDGKRHRAREQILILRIGLFGR
jgi:15-cis-phytoene synthase